MQLRINTVLVTLVF